MDVLCGATVQDVREAIHTFDPVALGIRAWLKDPHIAAELSALQAELGERCLRDRNSRIEMRACLNYHNYDSMLTRAPRVHCNSDPGGLYP